METNANFHFWVEINSDSRQTHSTQSSKCAKNKSFWKAEKSPIFFCLSVSEKKNIFISASLCVNDLINTFLCTNIQTDIHTYDGN